MQHTRADGSGRFLRLVPDFAGILNFDGMWNLIYVAFGGAVGASLRYAVASWISFRTPGIFPYGTLFVNLLGSLVIGWAWGYASHQTQIPIRLQLFVMTGLLGGFTTFSTFSLENWQLLQAGNLRLALIYMLISCAGGILLAMAGYRISGQFIMPAG